jgi:hypothetical protein
MIYFLQSVDGGPIKIGCTVNVERRVSELEAMYGQPLAVLHTMPGGRKEEAAIHARFDHLRFRGKKQGCDPEQFRPTAELLAFIGRPLLVTANPDSVEFMEGSIRSKPMAFQVRGSVEYKAVLEELAVFDGKSIASLTDHAIRIYARSINFPKPLPKR